MPTEHPLADQAEAEINSLKEKGRESSWSPSDVKAVFEAFNKWLRHPELLTRKNDAYLRCMVLNELTWLISDPIVGDQAWEYIRRIAKDLGKEDLHQLRESWIVAAFETFAEPPAVPEFLEKLFSLAGDEDTRWAVFGAYDNVPWRLRPHARKYSNGKVTEEDCDKWLIDSDRGDDEVLMQQSQPDKPE